MLKKWMILPIAAGFLAVNANAACDQIGSKDELDAFAAKVNGGDVSACAELTADIHYNETQVVNDALTGLANGTPANVWTPIGTNDNPFKGTIDGKGHTIYGLYLARAWEPAFVAKATGATIKNLNISDSYFRATVDGGDAGGIIGDIQVKSQAEAVVTTVENCSFEGVVYAETGAVNAGGLVGSIGFVKAGTRYYGATLNLSNSHNSGSVLGPGSGGKNGGLIGYVNNKAVANITNSFNVGTVENGNPLVGAKDGSAGTIGGKNIGCVGTGCGTNVTSGVVITNSKDELLKKVVENMVSSGNVDDLNTFFESNGSGVSFEEITFPSGNKGLMALLKPTKQGQTAEFSEDVAIVIPADVTVDVDKITLDRKYKPGVMSTVMFPFNIEAKYVTNANFFEFVGVNQETDPWEVTVRPMCAGNVDEYDPANCSNDDMLLANHPYFVKIWAGAEIAAESALNFASSDQRGNTKLTIVKTVGSALAVDAAPWKLQGTYEAKTWEEGNAELGSVFGYVSRNPSTAEVYPDGKFVKAGKNSSVKAMRAYLFYDRPAPSAKPALMKSAAVATTAGIAPEGDMKLVFVDYVAPEIKVETIPEQGVESEPGETQGLVGVKVPANVNMIDRWFDVNGRNMKSKPKTQGAFIKNGTPVIVK